MGLLSKKHKNLKFALAEEDGKYSFRDVVGESNYKQALQILISEGSDLERKRGVVFRDAHLAPEPSNAFDANAIQIRIASNLVGYIAKTHTAIFHTTIEEARKQGFDYLAVKAVIGFDSRKSDLLIGV